MYRISRLSHGVTVATAEMPHMASVSLGIWVAVGGRFEPAPLSGASHFIEHMLFKGTPRRNAQQISEAVEGIGGYLNAFTSEEHTCFYAKAHQDRLPEILDVLVDMFLHSTFDPGELRKERNVIKEELAMYLDQPQHYVHDLLNETLWPDQPLGRSLTGTNKTLDGLTRARLLDFRRRNYVTESTLIVAAGPVRHREFVRRVAKATRRIPVGPAPRFIPASVDQTRPAVRLFTKASEQTHLALGLRTCSRHDERRFALRLLNTILGENMSSRLFRVLREEHGLAYSIYSSITSYEDVGALTIAAGLDTTKLEKALRLIIRELRRMTETAPSAAEMRRARDYIIGQLELSLEGTENQMMWLGEHWLGYGKTLSAGEVKERLAKVGAGEVRGVARDFFRPQRLSLALVSLLKNADKLAPLLRF